MRLSRLQKFILFKCHEARNATERKAAFYSHYPEKEWKENKNSIQIRVQNSIENMVKKNWAVAEGYKTMKKFYIERVKLTAKGKKLAKGLIMKKQRQLPIR